MLFSKNIKKIYIHFISRFSQIKYCIFALDGLHIKIIAQFLEIEKSELREKCTCKKNNNFGNTQGRR